MPTENNVSTCKTRQQPLNSLGRYINSSSLNNSVDIEYQHVYNMKGYWLLLNELEPKRTEVKTIDRRRRLEQWGPALAMGGAGLQLQFTKSPLKKRWYRL